MVHQYTAIVRKSGHDYVAICLELNVSAVGSDMEEVEQNLLDAIELYLENIKEYPETVISLLSTEELIEFLNDTAPQEEKRSRQKKEKKNYLLRLFELREVPAYAEFIWQGKTNHAGNGQDKNDNWLGCLEDCTVIHGDITTPVMDEAQWEDPAMNGC